MSKISCIDIFCGVGGLTYGLISEGINVVAGIDLDPACQFPFEYNNKALFINADIKKISSSELNILYKNAKIKILVGCAPCQPFSTYSQRYDEIGSSRWGLLYEFARLVKSTSPDIVAMENVPSVAKHKVFQDFRVVLRKLGYHLFEKVIDCTEYGLPQKRRRYVLLASRHGEIQLIEPQKRKIRTVRDAIERLPEIGNGESCSTDLLHVASSLSPINLKRLRASIPGGTWRDWPKSLIADCHLRSTGKTYPGVYGRMSWDEPSPTLTTQFFGFGNGRFGHPEQDRAISLREGAILQGFPKNYRFVEPGKKITFKELGRLIGNAVPVTLGRVIGKSINNHIASKINLTSRKRRLNGESSVGLN